MKTPVVPVLVPVPPLPPQLSHRPPLLTCKEVKAVLRFWNLGGRKYFQDLRDCGELPSVTPFKDGRQARYSLEKLLTLYPREEGGRVE